ncbi:hypothetical protein CRENBAI_026745 [Crenichthys baileyi]|uniref:Uncharacterized protein n=1 Tax=Crenichthys baileyi TaxID=28760 RepID=A0AAV9RNY5_9TELE
MVEETRQKIQGSCKRSSLEIHGGDVEVSSPTNSENEEKEDWNPAMDRALEAGFPERKNNQRMKGQQTGGGLITTHYGAQRESFQSGLEVRCCVLSREISVAVRESRQPEVSQTK